MIAANHRAVPVFFLLGFYFRTTGTLRECLFYFSLFSNIVKLHSSIIWGSGFGGGLGLVGDMEHDSGEGGRK